MKVKSCLRCWKKKPIQGRGLCVKCYSRSQRDGTLNNYKIVQKDRYVVCKICGDRKVHYAKGLCHACYRSKKYKTIGKSIFSTKITMCIKNDIKPKVEKLYKKTADRIMDDIIANPAKYLKEVEKEMENGKKEESNKKNKK